MAGEDSFVRFKDKKKTEQINRKNGDVILKYDQVVVAGYNVG